MNITRCYNSITHDFEVYIWMEIVVDEYHLYLNTWKSCVFELNLDD